MPLPLPGRRCENKQNKTRNNETFEVMRREKHMNGDIQLIPLLRVMKIYEFSVF